MQSLFLYLFVSQKIERFHIQSIYKTKLRNFLEFKIIVFFA